MNYTDGRDVKDLSQFPAGATVFPVVSDGRSYYYLNGVQWFVFGQTGWMKTNAPSGNLTNVNGGTPCGPICCAPAGAQPVTPLGMQVQAQAVCEPPAAPQYSCQFNPCEPQVFIDCRRILWFKNPYGGWKICRGNGSWEDTELDTCPPGLIPLFYQPVGGYFWYKENGASWKYSQGWAENNDVPCGLREVYINVTTGQLFYYPICTEQEMREAIGSNPFCATGYT